MACYYKHLFLFALKASLVIAAALPLPFVQTATADTPVTAIFFPEIREPFRSVFTTIADGITETLNGQVNIRPITNEESAESLNNWLARNDVGVAVVLGSRGLPLSKELSPKIPVVIGAVHMSDSLLVDPHYGIALNPDPEILLSRLKALAPGVERVHIVYHREREQWLIDRAGRIAAKHGITLNPVAVDRLQEAANSYRELLSTQKSSTEALWLSQDSMVLDEQAILPMILKEAWDRKLIVFSNNPSHVRRGVLFAMYPDNQNMGRSLGVLAMQLHEHRTHGSPENPIGMRLLDALHTAFNVRTASRLGIRYTRDDLARFDLIFPPQ